MAPELQDYSYQETHGNFDPKAADMWAVGATAYLLFTRAYPVDWLNGCSIYLKNPEKYILDRLLADSLPPLALSFLQALLRPRPSERLTTIYALQHPWM